MIPSPDPLCAPPGTPRASPHSGTLPHLVKLRGLLPVNVSLLAPPYAATTQKPRAYSHTKDAYASNLRPLSAPPGYAPRLAPAPRTAEHRGVRLFAGERPPLYAATALMPRTRTRRAQKCSADTPATPPGYAPLDPRPAHLAERSAVPCGFLPVNVPLLAPLSKEAQEPRPRTHQISAHGCAPPPGTPRLLPRAPRTSPSTESCGFLPVNTSLVSMPSMKVQRPRMRSTGSGASSPTSSLGRAGEGAQWGQSEVGQ